MSLTPNSTVRGLFALFFLVLLVSHPASASGTWTPLTTAPPTGVNCALVLSDGSVLTDDGSGNINRLTPDIHGSYINGTWTRLTPMNNSRLFFSTELLTNGNVFVAGGEYGTGHEHAELFDPLRNIWSPIPDPIPSAGFSDCSSAMLPNGNVLIAPVSQFGGCLIYNVAGNNWQTAASTGNQDETCWVKLANDNIMGIETASQTTVHYVPSANTWITDNPVAVPVYGYGAELGPGFLLPNGSVFYIGGNTNTAIYTPGATPSSAGTWTAGPIMVFDTTNFLGAVDAPAAMMNNGVILCALGPVGGYNPPTSFYEYDYNANAFTQVTAPGGGTTYGSSPFGTSMLLLPDGTVLFIGGQNTTSLYVYTPSAPPIAIGQPAINSITENADGSYHLTGTNLTGISCGAAYGDDEQMNSDYPLIRMTNNVTGNVYYARTYNWNSTGLETGSKIITTEFTLPQGLPSGTYSLVATANGNPSVPTNFTYSPPPVPTGLGATSGSNSFSIVRWNASSGASAYNLKRSSSVTGYYATIATTTGLSFTNFGLTNGLEYFYKVAAVGSSGPSSDSASVGASPAGPTYIPGATQVSLSSYYNRSGIWTDGRTFSGGFDAGGTAYSALFLEPSVQWNNLIFNMGPSNALDVVSCAGQTIPLPAGRYNSLQILAAGVNGAQQSQTFIVTYTDASTAIFTQSLSDWANAQNYAGETTVMRMNYRVTSGGKQTLNMAVYGYEFTLDQTKTVQSITLPVNGNVVIAAMMLANDPVAASLAGFYNRAGMYTDGTTYTNPATGGMDGGGYAFSASLLTGTLTWSNALFSFGPANQTNVVSCASQTVPLPPGNYSRLRILATAVNGSQTAQIITVTYSDSTTANFSQNFSDWASPQGYFGETKAIYMSHRDVSDGSTDVHTFYLYGYNLTLNNAKTVQSIKLPSNNNVIVMAISLVPNWPPTFNVNPMMLPPVNAGFSYSGTIATNATDLNGDGLTFGKVSGPTWLGVAANGSLSGVPANSDANTNVFTVSVRDTGGLSNTATLYIYVNGAPYFLTNPFAESDVMAGQSYSGTIATNAADPNPGDTLTFAKMSGPAWLSVSTSGALSGTPVSSDDGTNNYTVSVTDPGGLSASANMTINVDPAPAIVSTASLQSGTLWLNWSGGIAPYDVQYTTDLVYGVWQNLGTISSNSLAVMPTNPATYFRIIGN